MNLVLKNIQTTIHFYLKAAELGNVHTINNLDFCFEKGIGIEKNTLQAFETLSKQHKRDFLIQCINTFITNLMELGVSEILSNQNISFNWLLKTNYPFLMFNMDYSFIEKNEEKAMFVFQNLSQCISQN
jgi:hypothetical protein